MNYLTIENKAAKVKLNDQVDKYSIDQVIEEIDQTYGMKAVEDLFSIGEVMACAENAIDTLDIEIHSPGGSVFEGYRLFNAIKELRNRGVVVTARINTIAASMGSVIAMAADKVEIASNGRIMIHEASMGTHGDANKMRQAAELLEGISDEIAGVYAEKTGKPQDEMRELMKKETWMTAKQAVDMGFADSIFDTKTKNMASILDKFRPDAALTEKVQGLEASLQSAQSEITDMTSAMAERTKDLENAISELTTAKSELVEAQANLTAISAERDTVKAELTTAQTQIAELQEKITKAEASANAKAIEIAAQAGLAPLDVAADEKQITNTKTREEFNKLTAREKSDFSKAGGRII